MGMKKQILFAIISIVIIISMIISHFLFIERDYKYSTIFTCEELKECIKDRIHCVDKKVYEGYPILKWSFENLANNLEQKKYYKNNCMDALSGDKE